MSEGYYDLALGERHNLIKKWGPIVERVVSFPANGEHYTLCTRARDSHRLELLD